ncbi:MAG: pilus assembly protein N-terminal domain-containing protein [Archangium sp.]|nr:pilus assembly protein N-terminal domain-containing protein [Archangium sp.]
MPLHRLALLLAVFTTSTAFAQQPLRLAVGAQKHLTIPGLQRVAVGDPTIADIKTLGVSELVVLGASRGRTTLLVWTAGATTPDRFEVTVTGPGSLTSAPTPIDTTPEPSFTATLRPGESTTRATPNLKRVAIGDPNIADFTTGTDTVTLLGVSAGQTTVLLWYADGHREQWLVTVVK